LVGVGLLGSAIAQRLLGAGVAVAGWDVAADRRAALVSWGGTVAANIGEVFTRCRRVVLSLPSHETVAAVLAESELRFRDDHVILDTSTGDPVAAEQFADELAVRNVTYLDATVSGSSAQVRDGHAVFLVGGTDAAFQANRELLSGIAAKVLHVGPAGSGARMKLVTNLVLGLNRAALAEGLHFAKALGLDPAATLHVLRECPSYSRAMEKKGVKMVRGEFTPEARLSQHLKDVRLMLAAAERAGAGLPLTETHRELLERAESLGLGPLDNSAIIQAIAESPPRDGP
jgi:3-hydroxyisobutyrate dehydrogenase-like beta-hydroxyacid dehydrogenase